MKSPSPIQIPQIISPISRSLAVSDMPTSLAFYRNILGFELTPPHSPAPSPSQAELISGPARIQLTVADTAVDSTGQSRPRGTAMLFLETDDVAAMRSALIARGGLPGELEKVNWIKMQMFAIHDPDGHTIWFGQSFEGPSHAKDPNRQLRKALPELPLENVAAGVAYYRDFLGFRINYAQADIGVMDRDDVTLILIARSEKHTGIGSCYIYIHDADALHAELVAKGANVLAKPVSHPWGLREFAVLDLEGNQIKFGQPFE